MGGYSYGEEAPVRKCPFCSAPCDADFVDVGVGYTQCGPYYCSQCGASEIGPYDVERLLSADEKAKGWYGPQTEPGSSANVIGGKVVSHRVMRSAYRDEFRGNALYEVPGAVEEWFEKVRKQGL